VAPRTRVRTENDSIILARLEANLETLTISVTEIRTVLAMKVDRLEREKVSYGDLGEHFQRLEKTCERMETALSTRVDTLERMKASRQEHDDAEGRSKKELHDHESRIRGLEQFRWKALGIATGFAGLVSFLNHKLMQLMEGK
jgi:uncharacterized membrane protein YccC